MTALAPDAAREPGTRASFTTHVKGAIDRLMRALPGKRRRDANARAEAILALSAMVGAVMLARAVDDTALGDEILAATRQGLAD